MATRRDPDLQRAIGERLGRLRRAAGLTQEALAEEVGIQPHGLSRIEQGHRMPSISTLAALAEGVGVTLADLVAVEKDVPEPKQPPDVAEAARLVAKLDRKQRRAVISLLKTMVPS
jgi:transcriptional regulator with XRE-family HTH domain